MSRDEIYTHRMNTLRGFTVLGVALLLSLPASPGQAVLPWQYNTAHRPREMSRTHEPAARPAPAKHHRLTTIRVPGRIDATGTTDVTRQLQKFLSRVPDDRLVEFPTAARYRIEDTVSIVDKHRLVLEGNGAKLFETTKGYRERSLLSVVGGSDVTVRDFHLRGADRNGGVDGQYVADLEAQHGIELFGPKRVLIKHNRITHVWGDFIYLARDQRRGLPSWREPARDVTIKRNTMARNGRQGVSFINVSRVLVIDNHMSDMRRAVFDFEPTTTGAVAKDVTIESNTVGAHQLNFLSAGGNGSVEDVRVDRNTLVGGTMMTMVKNAPGETRRNFSFVANTSDRGLNSNLGAAVIARGVEGIEFRKNVQPMNRRQVKDGPMAGLFMIGSCDGVSRGNIMGPYGGQQMLGDNPPCAQPVTVGVVALPAPVRAG
jgi:hypothetical protein